MPKRILNKRYNSKFKQMIVEAMKQEKLIYCEVAQQFDIPDYYIVSSWERIYLMEGPKGLYIKRRGRSGKGRSQQYPKKVEEALQKAV